MKIAHDIYMAAIAGDFDVWRDHYPSLSIEDLIWINTAIFHFYPRQAHYNLHEINALFGEVKQDGARILELGCFRGELAAQILAIHAEIEIWIGMDISYHAISNPAVKDKRYLGIKLTDWIFNTSLIPIDIMIASHTLEHFDGDQIKKVFRWAHKSTIQFIVVEMPFSISRWSGYRGSHIYQGSKTDLIELAEGSGYRMHLDQTQTIFALRRLEGWKQKNKKPDTII